MSRPFVSRAGLSLLASALLACASAPNRSAATDGAGCALRPQDSTFIATGPVYRDCAVETKAVLLTKDIHPDFRPESRNGACYSAEVDYVVNEAGFVETKTARIVRTNNQAYAESIMSILPQWKFEPARRDGVPVRQIVVGVHKASVSVVVLPAGTRPSASTRPPRQKPSC